MQAEIEAFLRAIEDEPDVWRSCDVRIAAARLEGQWIILAARLLITGREPHECPTMPYALDVDQALIGQECRPITDLRPLLVVLADGRLRLHDKDLVFAVRNEPGPVTLNPIRWFAQSRSLEDGYGRGLYSWAARLLVGEGSPMSTLSSTHPELRDQLAEVARIQSGPFLDFNPRAKAALEFDDRGVFGGSCAIEFEARHELRIITDRFAVLDGTLTLPLIAGSRAATRTVTVEVEIMRDGVRDVITPTVAEPDEWLPTQRGLIWEHRMTVGDCDRVAVTIRCGREKTEVRTTRPYRVTAGSPFVEAYRTVDADLDVLRDTLAPKTPAKKLNAPDFEEAVARLFCLAGWHVDHIAHSKLKESVDVMAHSPALQTLLAIECTLGSPGKDGKHAKLHARCGDLRDGLVGISVQGVLVTALSEKQVLPDEIDSFTRSGIWLCTREDLAILMTQVATGGTILDTVLVLQEVAGRRRGRATIPRPH